MNTAAPNFAFFADPDGTLHGEHEAPELTYFPCPRCDGHGCILTEKDGVRAAALCPRCNGDRSLGATPDEVEEAAAISSDNPFCPHDWSYSGTAYGGDDESYHGEGRCYCSLCGADGDA